MSVDGECVADLCLDRDCGDGLCIQNGVESSCLCGAGVLADKCAASESPSCGPGMVEDGELCVPVGPDEPGDEPTDSCTCTAPHQTCSGDTCTCAPGFAPHPDVPDLCLAGCDVAPELCAAAQASAPALSSANGFGAVVYDQAARKATTFLEHLYRNWDDGDWTRDLLYDSYFGVRRGNDGQWLDQVAPVHAGYYGDSGIIHVVQRTGDLRVDTFLYAPWQLERPALVLLGKLTNEGDTEATVSLYSLHNYRLGYTSAGDPSHPDAAGERIVRDASGAYVEQGVGGTLVHWPIGGADRAGCTPDNPWQALNDGQPLANTEDSGAGADRVAGFERQATLAPGDSTWLGVVTAFAPDQNAAALLADVAAAYDATTPDEALAGAYAEWEAWRAPPPDGLLASELAAYRQSEAMLRQGQVHEASGAAHGQIVASLPPGRWNITWVRDLSYAVAALVRSGHLAEAHDALAFVLDADAGTYDDYVGRPYQVSVTRYFGRGKEESDTDQNGPNIELDGFGLFLWALAEYVEASGDDSLVTPEVESLVAEALLDLVEPSGLVQADSSIWEVHWNGQQKHFSFTSITAAVGLCRLARLYETQGDAARALLYRTAGQSLRDAVLEQLTDADGALMSSLEDPDSRDMAAVEAVSLGLVAGDTATAGATLEAVEDLRVDHGHGFRRNDAGGWYDSQEWVFTDLRTAVARERAGEESQSLVDWITAQAQANAGVISELHDPTTAAYAGEAPMVGFGAGAYVLAMYRGEPGLLACDGD